MIILLSPSKTQDASGGQALGHLTTPPFLKEAETLVHELQQYDKNELKELLEVNDKLAELNYERYQSFETPFHEGNAQPAFLVYQGDVYDPIHAESYHQDEFAFAQNHVRILTGLYGIVRPLDLIQPYRLEMKTNFTPPESDNLYDFWRPRLTEFLNEELKVQEDDYIINLASNQYFKAIDKRKLEGEVITPKFKDWKSGKYKTIAIYAKKARGMMTEFIIRHQIHNVQDLKTFDEVGYYFNDEASEGNEWVFTRDW